MNVPADILNRPLEEGDYVIVTRKDYRDLVVARIVGFTPKQIRVVYMANGNYPQAYLTNQVVLINKSDLNARKQDKILADQAYENKDRAL